METNSRVVVGEGAGQVVFSQKERLTLIAGPCQMESREHAFMIAGELSSSADRSGSDSSINLRSTRRTAPRFPANAASGSTRRWRSSPTSSGSSVFRC